MPQRRNAFTWFGPCGAVAGGGADGRRRHFLAAAHQRIAGRPAEHIGRSRQRVEKATTARGLRQREPMRRRGTIAVPRIDPADGIGDGERGETAARFRRPRTGNAGTVAGDEDIGDTAAAPFVDNRLEACLHVIPLQLAAQCCGEVDGRERRPGG
jgi:hypothetical protein